MYQQMAELVFSGRFDAHNKPGCLKLIKDALRLLVEEGFTDETSFEADPKKISKAFVKAGQSAKARVRCLPLLACLFLLIYNLFFQRQTRSFFAKLKDLLALIVRVQDFAKIGSLLHRQPMRC